MQTIFLTLLWIGLIGGQVLSLPFMAGARFTFLDVSIVFVLLYAATKQGKKRYIPPLWGPILAFGAVTIISLALTYGSVPTYVIGGGLLYVLRWVSYAALYWVASSTLIAPGAWITLLVYSGIGIAGIGVMQYVWYPDLRNLYYLGWDPHYQRLFSTLLDPNFTGIILGMTAIALLSGIQKKVSATHVAGFAVVLVALILTYSRSSLLATGAGFLLFGILTKRKALIGWIFAAGIALLLVLPHTGEGRNLLRTVSSYARIGNAERAMTLIREKPVFGHGYNLLRFVATDHSWIDETLIPSRSGSGLDTSFLFVGATTGIVGMAVYLWLIVRLFRMAIPGLQGNAKQRLAAAGYISTLSALVVHSIFINSLFYPWILVWMWVGTGVAERLTADR